MSSYFPLSLISLAVAGFGAVTIVASSVLQTTLEEDKRGRVMSFFPMSFMGIAPFGGFCAGSMAGTIGPLGTLLVGAARKSHCFFRILLVCIMNALTGPIAAFLRTMQDVH